MSTVRIRRHPDAPWAADLDQFELQGIQPGQEIEVPAEMAGQPPHWRRVEPGEERVPFREYRQHAGHLEVHDLGTGLLAQLGLWEPATPVRATATNSNEQGSDA